LLIRKYKQTRTCKLFLAQQISKLLSTFFKSPSISRIYYPNNSIRLLQFKNINTSMRSSSILRTVSEYSHTQNSSASRS
jgi:hypothetical protein